MVGFKDPDLTVPDLPEGTVTFLFMVIEGSTLLLKRLGTYRYGQVLADQRHLLGEALAYQAGCTWENYFQA